MKEFKKALGDRFELITAFSRETSKKVYVQHRLREKAKKVNELLLKKAYFYVCGDAANMAREVHATLTKILVEERDIPEGKAEDIVKRMRDSTQYQVRKASYVLPTLLGNTAVTETPCATALGAGSRRGHPRACNQPYQSSRY